METSPGLAELWLHRHRGASGLPAGQGQDRQPQREIDTGRAVDRDVQTEERDQPIGRDQGPDGCTERIDEVEHAHGPKEVVRHLVQGFHEQRKRRSHQQRRHQQEQTHGHQGDGVRASRGRLAQHTQEGQADEAEGADQDLDEDVGEQPAFEPFGELTPE